MTLKLSAGCGSSAETGIKQLGFQKCPGDVWDMSRLFPCVLCFGRVQSMKLYVLEGKEGRKDFLKENRSFFVSSLFAVLCFLIAMAAVS